MIVFLISFLWKQLLIWSWFQVLIAKKAHTISTLSTLHDRIMTRYYKFLIVNVLVFFCIGVTALQSFLVSFSQTTGSHIITVLSASFPNAGPFYVGWSTHAACSHPGSMLTLVTVIFTMGIHGGLELALCKLSFILRRWDLYSNHEFPVGVCSYQASVMFRPHLPPAPAHYVPVYKTTSYSPQTCRWYQTAYI